MIRSGSQCSANFGALYLSVPTAGAGGGSTRTVSTARTPRLGPLVSSSLMKDGPFRRSLKAVARALFVLDVGVDRKRRTLRGERPHGLGGECRRCAGCCEAPAIRANAAVWHLRTLRWAFLRFQEWVNGFELQEARARDRVFVFRCTHFDWTTRTCDSYASRPGMCRDYPRALLFQAAPEMLPGCGYRPLPPNAAGLRRALEARGLPPAQLERLKKDLDL